MWHVSIALIYLIGAVTSGGTGKNFIPEDRRRLATAIQTNYTDFISKNLRVEDTQYIVPECFVNGRFSRLDFDNRDCDLFQLAALYGSVNMAKLLLQKKKDFDIVRVPGSVERTPLEIAVSYGHAEFIEYLWNMGRHHSIADKDHGSLLHVAVISGHLKAADSLISRCGIDVNFKNNRDETPLMVAALSKRNHETKKEMIVKLLIYGADSTHTSSEGFNIFHRLCHTDHTEIIKIIMESFCPKDDQNHQKCVDHLEDNKKLKSAIRKGTKEDEDTPLHFYARFNAKDNAKQIIGYGAKVNAANKYRITPLMVAASEDSLEVAQLLVREGAKINDQNKSGQSVLHLALAYGKSRIAAYLIQLEGIKLDAKDKAGETPLDYANKYCVKIVSGHGQYTDDQLRVQQILMDLRAPGNACVRLHQDAAECGKCKPELILSMPLTEE